MGKKTSATLISLCVGLIAAAAIFGVRFQLSTIEAESKGSLTVCVAIMDKDYNALLSPRGDIPDTTFTVPITVHDGDKVTVIQNATFSSSGFSPNARLFKSSKDDAECITYDNLQVKDYYYRREIISGSHTDAWKLALYNDEYDERVHNLSDFYPLNKEDDNADRTIVLQGDRKHRRLVVLNEFKGSFKDKPKEPPKPPKPPEPPRPPKEEKAKLKVIKAVINTGGGTKQVSDFRLFVDGAEVKSGEEIELRSGTYTVTEHGYPGIYEATFAEDCTHEGKIKLEAGDRKVCTLTNKFIPPTPPVTPEKKGCIAVHKDAFNADNSTTTPTPAFTFRLDGSGTFTTDASGNVTISGVTVGEHFVSEIVPIGWNLTSIIPASSDGRVTVREGSECAPILFKNVKTATTTPPLPPSGLSVVCAPSQRSVLLGNLVTFTASPSGGTGTYSYLWRGVTSEASTSQSVATGFGNIGTRSVSVLVTSGNQTATAECSVEVFQNVINGGGGGGIAPPRVTVSREAPGRVAGVFLSQIPYTGIGSGLKITLFICGLLAWSSWLSYFIIKRKARKSGRSVSELLMGIDQLSRVEKPAAPHKQANGFLEMKEKIKMSIPIVSHIDRSDITLVPHEPQKPKPLSAAPFMIQPAVSRTPASTPQENVFEKTESLVAPGDIIEALEQRSRELQTIVAADGLESIAKAANNNRHTAVIILNHLVELYKNTDHEVEGNWMVLNNDKISRILFSTFVTMTPVFVEWLARGDHKKVMSFVRMLQIQGQTIQGFVTHITLELDKAYRYRIERVGDADITILDMTMQWSNEELELIVHTLVSAVDQAYTSINTSIKIALVKILEMSKVKYYA